MKYELMQAGYCTHSAHIAVRGESRYTMKFPALVVLLKHPTEGYMLFDTGYTTQFYEETRRFPFSLYEKTTPVFIQAGESAKEQLEAKGITPRDVRYVFISHFHADHIAGLNDFPYSTFICSKEAYSFVKGRTGIRAALVAYIPSLLPKDFEERVRFIEDFPTGCDVCESMQPIVSIFQRPLYDVLGDGSCLAIHLGGHARGQYGLLFRSKEETVFLMADAVWRSIGFRENRPPHLLAYFIMDSTQQYNENFQRFVRLHKMAPSIRLIPSHCEEPLEGMLCGKR